MRSNHRSVDSNLLTLGIFGKMTEELLSLPLALPREKHLKMLFHLLCVVGKTSHCDLERNISKQALINCLHVSGRST
jgi:hypothetical protein